MGKQAQSVKVDKLILLFNQHNLNEELRLYLEV